MGIVGNLKDLYFAAEDKYYRVLDKINATVPIYKIIDPIDKVVPSFLLLILAIAVLAVGLIVLPGLAISQTELTLIVEDELGNGLPGIDVSYKVESISQSITTDADGKAVLMLMAGESVRLKILEVTVNEVEYKALESTIEVLDEDMEKRLILERKTLPLIERTLVFQNASGGRISGKPFKIRLSCSSGVIPIPQEVTDLDRDGTITVTEPPGCGVMQATVLEPEEFAGDAYLLDKTTVILRLEADEVEKGSVRVKVKDEGGRIIDEVNFNISLRDQDGLTLQEKDSQYYGEVIFRDIVPGEYSIGVVDPREDYAISTETGIFVTANETESVTVIVSKSIKGTLEIQAINLNNGSDISEATIRLIDSSGRIVVEEETGENGEAVLFPLMNEDDYTIFAMHEDYLYGELDLNGQIDGSVDIEMERLTSTNSGRIEVKVLDEDDEVVENARVKLRFLDTDFLAPYHPQVTDFNGVAKFSGVKEGSYYAYVEKFPTSGDNKGFGLEIDIRTITKFTVSLFVGETTINITAVDEDQDPVPEAEVEFFSITGKSLGKIPLTDGTGTYSLKADKKIYLVVKHPNFQQVQTMPEQLYPGSTLDFVAKLEPRLISGDPTIEYLGIFTPSGATASAIESGQRYLMKFKFSVPHAESYDSAGVHFRVGNERLLANDPLIIKDVIVGNSNAPLKGTTFTPPTGYEQDLDNLTEGDAKWVNFEWTDIEAGDYFFGIEVRVKGQITPNTLLPMHYRAWAKPSANQVTRDPYDSTLGVDESTSSKQALYAKAYYLEYYEAESVQCDEEFCYSGEWVRDEDQGLYIYRPYGVRINAPHKFNFVISNNSDTVYENSKLYITSLFGGMRIKGYEIQDAEARTVKAENINVLEIGDIELGTFTKGKTINAKLDFVPKEIGSDYFEIKIVADGKVVFQKDVYFSLESQLNMIIGVEPDLLPSYVEFPLIVTVKEVDEDGLSLEMEDALVIVTKTAADRSEEIWTSRSNSLGKADFTIPASPAGTKITVEAEMPGYSAEPVVLYIDSNVLRFDPAKIVSALSTRDQTEEIIFETITNLIPNDLKLVNTQVRGYFKGLLDTTNMENYLAQFRNLEINEMGTVDRELFKIKLSENASVLLKRADSVEGEFWLTFKNEAANVVYDFVIPMKVNVTISGLPETENCLVITKSEWTTVTQGNAAILEFEVQNNCMSDGKFLPLDKIVSTIEWTSDIMGNVELSLTDSQTGEANIETLKPIIPATLFENVRPESIYYGLLTFTPFQGYLGDDAQFQVYINGQMFTGGDEGYESVGSSPEYINSKIKIINLDSCITYEGAETVVIVPSAEGSSTTFTVDSSECGETSIDVSLCRQDPNCSGGAEGGITVSPLSFTLSDNNPVQEVTVMPQSIPGMYGIGVDVRSPGHSYQKVRNLDILIEPDSTNDFLLDKYEFSVKGIGAQDQAKLTNKALSESVSVDASACDWGTAEDDGMFDALLGAGLGAAVGGLMGMEPAMKAASAGMEAGALAKDGVIRGATDLAGTTMDAAEKALTVAKDALKSVEKVQDTIKNSKKVIAAEKKALDALFLKHGAAIDTACCTSGALERAEMAAASTTAVEEVINTCLDTATDYVDMAQQATDMVTEATDLATEASSISDASMKVAAPKGAEGVASAHKAAIAGYTSAKEVEEAAKLAAEQAKELFDATTDIGKTLATNVADIATEVTVDETVYTETIAELNAVPCVCPVTACPHAACTAAKAKANTALTAALQEYVATVTAEKETIDLALTASTEAITFAVDGGMGLTKSLIPKQTDAIQSLGDATDSTKLMGEITDAASNAAGFDYGTFAGIIGTYSMLGAIAGAMAAMLMGDDPCEERVVNTLMDYIMNLKDDSLPIGLDKAGLSAVWETEDAKVFGDYTSQEVGIIFTNDAVEPGEPTYSTSTISATRHHHANPTIIPLGNSNFGPFNVPDDTTETYSQKFHLKFNTKTIIEKIPQYRPDSGCLQGTMLGSTGDEALPEVKLNWTWDEEYGVGVDGCLANDEGVYCDATQFSIMIAKRVKRLNDFLSVNNFGCPSNPAIEELARQIEEYNNRLLELGMPPIAIADIPECWMPHSTVLFDGKPALLYYVEAGLDNVNWTNEVPDLDTLKGLLQFKAKLMKDGFSEDFQEDFTDYYITQSFYDAPDWFSDTPSNKYSEYFGNTDRLSFKTRYIGQTDLPSAGIYEIILAVVFENDAWQFFYNNEPTAKVVVDMHLVENPYPDSIFYYLPFNGGVGKGSSDGRIGYGLGYSNNGNEFRIKTELGSLIDTEEVPGSTTIGILNTDTIYGFKNINSLASNRGMIMKVERGASPTENDLLFYPHFATPIVMRVSAEATDDQYNAFFELVESTQPRETGANLSFWTGAGQCLDFTGIPVFEKFNNTPDREGTSNDNLVSWQFVYALDWEKVERDGEVFLKTNMYSPINGSYLIRGVSPGLGFISPDSAMAQSVELKGISGMTYNSKDAGSSVTELNELFSLVRSEQVCVTDSGSKTMFWWNPRALYEAEGEYTSLSTFESGLIAGQSCMGYSG